MRLPTMALLVFLFPLMALAQEDPPAPKPKRPADHVVLISIDGLRPGYVVYFLVDPTSVDGRRIWSAEAWYTLNRIPRE